MSDTPPSRQRATGRKSISATAQPRDLMAEDPVLAHAWMAQIVTLLPQAFPGVLGESLTGRALHDGLWQLHAHDLRSHGEGKHRNVDDTPAGGGAGMVLRADVVARALTAARARARGPTPMIYLSPRGIPFSQSMAATLARADGVILLCGRFEGVDERVIEHFGMTEVSMGDYVLTGGEIAAQALIDATVRLIPRVLGNDSSTQEESFSHGLLEHPQYTKPALWEGREIPAVLRGGNHALVSAWRDEQSRRLTKNRRPDLWRAWCAAHDMDPDEDQSS